MRQYETVKRSFTNGKYIYYAHSKLIYNTEREKKELSFIKSSFPNIEVLDPNKDMKEFDKLPDGTSGPMEPYLKKVETCWAVVCSRVDRHVSKGVYEEIKTAILNKIPVWCIIQPNKLVRVKQIQIVNPSDWRFYYGKLLI